MKKNSLLKILSVCLVFVLVTAAAITFTSCNEKAEPKTPENQSETPSESETNELTKFTLEITFADGNKESKEYESAAKTVGKFLREEKIAEGTESEQYGLMILTVKGETHDYNTDKSYWSFYIDGEYASTGVDSTPIEEGKTYGLVAEISE